MSKYCEKKCTQCGQQLRVPANIGGMLMACPSCGKKFHSDFKLSAGRVASCPGMVSRIFGLPYLFFSRIRRFLLTL